MTTQEALAEIAVHRLRAVRNVLSVCAPAAPIGAIAWLKSALDWELRRRRELSLGPFVPARAGIRAEAWELSGRFFLDLRAEFGRCPSPQYAAVAAFFASVASDLHVSQLAQRDVHPDAP